MKGLLDNIRGRTRSPPASNASGRRRMVSVKFTSLCAATIIYSEKGACCLGDGRSRTTAITSSSSAHNRSSPRELQNSVVCHRAGVLSLVRFVCVALFRRYTRYPDPVEHPSLELWYQPCEAVRAHHPLRQLTVHCRSLVMAWFLPIVLYVAQQSRCDTHTFYHRCCWSRARPAPLFFRNSELFYNG